MVAEVAAEEGHGGELGAVCFGGSDGVFLSSVKRDDEVAFSGHIRAGVIGDGGGEHVLAARFGQHGDDVWALTTLADTQNQRVAQAGWLLVDGEEAGGGEGYLQTVARTEDVL